MNISGKSSSDSSGHLPTAPDWSQSIGIMDLKLAPNSTLLLSKKPSLKYFALAAKPSPILIFESVG